MKENTTIFLITKEVLENVRKSKNLGFFYIC